MPGPLETLQVWQIPIHPLGADLDLMTQLAPDEQSRAARLRVPGAAEQFIQTRVALRRLLGNTLDLTPGDLHFGTLPRGKPFLRSPSGSGLEFSVAHCRSLALIALGRGEPVGIDVEPSDTPPEAISAIREILHPSERDYAETLEARLRARFLLHRWVGREAFAKATGVGLGGLDAAAITWEFRSDRGPATGGAEGAIPAPVRIHGRDLEGTEIPGDWWLRPLHLDLDYVAALVTVRSETKVLVRTWRWHGHSDQDRTEA